MHQSIVNLASQMPVCAGISSTLLSSLCTAAQAELERRLLSEVTAQSLGDRFLCAAALLAASMCAAISGGDEESLRAGSVAVSRRSGGKARASELRAEAFGLLDGSIVMDGFAVLGVDCDHRASE